MASSKIPKAIHGISVRLSNQRRTRLTSELTYTKIPRPTYIVPRATSRVFRRNSASQSRASSRIPAPSFALPRASARVYICSAGKSSCTKRLTVTAPVATVTPPVIHFPSGKYIPKHRLLSSKNIKSALRTGSKPVHSVSYTDENFNIPLVTAVIVQPRWIRDSWSKRDVTWYLEDWLDRATDLYSFFNKSFERGEIHRTFCWRCQYTD
ncbi:hypothetical protein M501DRAFT_998197, partial [Patellaria atrata CBS 101060]